MKESLEQLQTLLKNIIGIIETRISLGKINLEDFDELLNDDPIFLEEVKDHMNDFRNRIVLYKKSDLFYDEEVLQLEGLLTSTLKQIHTFKGNKLRGIDNEKINKPNDEIKRLLKNGILKEDTLISGEKQGRVITGYLTPDGFLELDINGTKRKFGSLRWAALEVWGSDISSQWKFWKVKETEMPLEYFRNLLYERGSGI